MISFKKSQAVSAIIGVLSSVLLNSLPAYALDSVIPVVGLNRSEWENQTVIPGVTPFRGRFEVYRQVGDRSSSLPAIARVTFGVYLKLTGNCETSTVPTNRIAWLKDSGSDVNNRIYTDTPGLYTPEWNGLTITNSPIPAGFVCYRFTARDSHDGLIRELFGPIAVAPTPGGSGSGSGSGTGSGTGSGAGSGGVVLTSGPTLRLNHSVNPHELNFRTGPFSTSIEAVARQNINVSLTIKVQDEGGRPVRDLGGVGSLVAGTTLARSWDGTCDPRTTLACSDDPIRPRYDRSKVKSGTYYVRYFIAGFQEAWDAVIVHNDPAPPPPLPPEPPLPSSKFSDISVFPTSFNPRTGEYVTFSFRVLQAVRTGLIIRIKDASGGTVHSNVFGDESAPLNPRIVNGFNELYTASWLGGCRNASRRDACSSDGFVAPGRYQFVFLAEGDQVHEGTLEVTGEGPGSGTQPPLPGQFIVPPITVTPNQPEVGQGATITFTTGKDTRNLRAQILSLTDPTLRKDITLSPSVGAFAPRGNYTATWDGKFRSGGSTFSAPAGTYNYRISADGETPVTGTFEVVPTGTPLPNFEVSLIGPDPVVFSPALAEFVSFRLTINQSARITARIFKGTQVVKTIASNASRSAGEIPFRWIGDTDSERMFTLPEDNGTYTLFLDAQNDRGQTRTEQRNIKIRNGTALPPPPSDRLRITRFDPLRNPFNPDQENTAFRYSLNQNASVTITIRRASDNSFIIRTLVDNQRRNATTTHEETWSGTDQQGNRVSDGIYRYTISATNSNDSDSVTGEVEVLRIAQNECSLFDLGPSQNVFDPEIGETTTLRYQINRVDCFTTVEILDGGASGTTLVSLRPTRSISHALQFEAVWDGRDNRGLIVPNDTYAYRIIATLGPRRIERIGYVRVATGFGGDGGDDDDRSCAGFRDVSKDDPLCPAVEFAVRLGIFMGDSGRNTLRPEDEMTRAETAAVTQRAFGYSLATYSPARDGNLGFRDLIHLREWYMPYLKTYTIRSVLEGYPNRTMRPERIMGRAELYKMFANAAFEAPRAVAHFVIERKVTWKPFVDTPVERKTKWYLPYADFAAANQLVEGRHFRPGQGITRGEVIQLIYDTAIKGLITYRASANWIAQAQ